jgi:hypothetical protein
MAKRKRITFGDNSFESVALDQNKKIKKMNPQSGCKQVHSYVHHPVFDSETDELKGTNQKEYSFKNCFLRGLDKETIAYNVNRTRQWLRNNLSDLPIYLINAHSSFDPRITLEKQYDDQGRRVTRREKAKRQKIEDNIREYVFNSQLRRGMSLMRYDDSNKGPNFFTLPEGVFIIETTPVTFDAGCGYDTIKRFFKQNSNDRFINFKNSFLSPKFNQLFYQKTTDQSVRLIIPPSMSAFNKSYSFYDDVGETTYEKYGILKFTSDMSQEEINSNLLELDGIEIKITKENSKMVQKSTIFSNTQLSNLIMQSVDDNTEISLQQITDQLGEGIYLDFSCSGLVYHVYEPQGGRMVRNTFDPDLELNATENRANMIIYNTLKDSFEELERQYKLHMDNIVLADESTNSNFHTHLPAGDDESYLTTKSNFLADRNEQLTMEQTGLKDPNLMETDTDSVISGGGKKKRKTRQRLPKLRKLSKKKVRHRYKLKSSTRKRRMALNEGVRAESKKRGTTMKKAAISKKGRFNLLRIYRRNKDPKGCRKITRDMRYLDKKYKLGKTKDICTKKKRGKVKRRKTRRVRK